MRFSVLLLIIFILNLSASGQSDIKLSTNTIFNGENSLTVNPVDQKNLICAWMTMATGLPVKLNIAVSYTLDGGNTWSTPFLIPRQNNNRTQADPTIIFDNTGTAYLGYIDYRSQRDSGEVYVIRSTNKGATWDNPSKVIDVFASVDKPVDRPWLAFNEKMKQLVVVTKSLNDAPHPHHAWMITSSTTGALNFQTPVLVDDSIPIGSVLNSMGVPACDAQGNIYVTYLSYVIPQSVYPRLIMAKSNNGGVSFTYRIMEVFPANASFPKNDSLYQYSYHIAVNPKAQNELMALCADYRYGDEDVLVMKSLDSGNTWGGLQRINDDAQGNGKGQDMCWGGYNASGVYAAAWRDRRNETNGQLSKYQVYTGYYVKAWKNDSVSSGRGTLYTPVDGNDFLGIAVSDSFINCTWADARSGPNEVYFNRVKINYPVGISSGIEDQEIKLFPNPVHDFLQVEFLKRGEYFEIYDMVGKLVVSGLLQNKIDVRMLPKGTYTLVMKESKMRFIKD